MTDVCEGPVQPLERCSLVLKEKQIEQAMGNKSASRSPRFSALVSVFVFVP